MSVVSKEYWKSACGEIRNLRKLIFAALICALSVVIGGFYIMVGENLRVYFTFFLTAVGAAVYGPVMGMMVGAVTDTLNYMLFPSGAYFPGYLLSEMTGAFIYGIFLYRKKISVLRIFGAKFMVNYFVNVLMGCLWSQMLYGKGYMYYLVTSFLKNSLLLPIEVLVLAALFAVLIPAFSRFGVLPGHEKKDIERLAFTNSVLPVIGLDCLVAMLCSFVYSTRIEKGVEIFRGIGCLLGLLGMILLAAAAVRKHRSGMDNGSGSTGNSCLPE